MIGIKPITLALVAVLAAFLAPVVRAQEQPEPIFPTKIIDPSVGYVQVSVVPAPDNARPYPIITLGSGERFEIGFDLLDDVPHNICYTVQHCTARWEPSSLVAADYLSGPPEGLITSSVPSVATMVTYRHYSIPLGAGTPHNLLLSGNYLLKAYSESVSGAPLFEAAFAVAEGKADISMHITAATQATHYNKHQQVDLWVRPAEGFPAQEHYYYVAVGQNGSPYRSAALTQPNEVAPGLIGFSGPAGAVFASGNTFKSTEILTDKYNGMGVNHSYSQNGLTFMELFTDYARGGRSFTADQSAPGNYIIRNTDTDAPDEEISTDYYAILFTLNTEALPEPPTSGITLEGAAFDALPEGFRTLSYDPATGLYQAQILLKGGYIAYRYCPLNRTGLNPIEGDFYQTHNNYTALVYLKSPADRYHRLLAYNTTAASSL